MTADEDGGTGGVLGVLGGMGPHASAAFLRTLYETAAERRAPATEQELPRCLLDSDPGFPDRTEAIRAGDERELTDRLARRLTGLLAAGATRTVVTCVTAHHFADRLEPALRERLISLVEVVLDDLEVAGGGRFLLMATDGTRHARVFERAARWPALAGRVVLPPPPEQRAVHRLVYRLKRAPVTPELVGEVESLVERNGCTGFIAGCTELHLVTRWLEARHRGPHVIDPLRSIATDLRKLLDT